MQIVKHNPDLAQLVVANGGVAALVDNVADTKSNNRLPGIMALGYIGAFSETLAQAIISENGLVCTKKRFFNPRLHEHAQGVLKEYGSYVAFWC